MVAHSNHYHSGCSQPFRKLRQNTAATRTRSRQMCHSQTGVPQSKQCVNHNDTGTLIPGPSARACTQELLPVQGLSRPWPARDPDLHMTQACTCPRPESTRPSPAHARSLSAPHYLCACNRFPVVQCMHTLQESCFVIANKLPTVPSCNLTSSATT